MARPARPIRPRAARGLLLLLAALPCAAAAPQGTRLNRADVGQGEQASRLFSIPETRDARAQMQTVEGHLAAARWSEALQGLQRLIDWHANDALPARTSDASGRLSEHPFHTGAGHWAERALTELPAEARELYRARHEKTARTAVVAARATSDRRALVEVALRWPLTDAAALAWWTLGDLEIELGHARDAERCWRRAAATMELAGREVPPGGARRMELARSLAGAASGDALGGPQAELRSVGPGEGAGPVPEEYAEAWTHPVPKSAFRDKRSEHNLFPVLAGDEVFLANGWQVTALDAYSGEERWESRELPGWVGGRRLDLVRGIDEESVMVAPAVSGSVVVAPLQVPHSRLGYTDFQGIKITVPIPERRLFAFDRETGRPLWNHSPPPGWDGESGSFEERMILAGPPSVAGSRVVVPCYLMQGRVDFHVACYDIATGARLWSTQLVSGQRPLNMFGRHEKEFCAPPVRIEGDRVVVLTDLGTIAALDLYTGRTLWQSLYEQIPLPPTQGWHTQERPQTWRNAPPVVADGVVLATPTDSRYLVAIDLAEGTALWQLPNDRLSDDKREAQVDTLLGADETTIYLGGRIVAAFRSPAGFARRSPGARLTLLWSYGVEGYDSRRSPRAVLARDELIVPTRGGRVVLDRATGLERRRRPAGFGEAGPERAALGNLAVGSGMLFTANSVEISGLFDWTILEARARERLTADPGDGAALLTLAQVREQRAQTAYQTGDVRGAVEHLAAAEALLAPRVDDPERGPEIAARLHRVLRSAAGFREGLADVPGALELLARAAPLAPTAADLRDTLLQREAVVRDRDREAWLATLVELERRCERVDVPAEAWRSVLAPDELDLDAVGDDLPVPLWVHFARASAFARWDEPARELEELHACLARFATRGMAAGRTVHDLVARRVEGAVRRGGAAAYAPFEERARVLYGSALASGSARELEDVRRLYPQSGAARLAAEALLRQAFAADDVERVVRLVGESASPGELADDDEARRLLILAEALAGAGNEELLRGVLQRLVRERGDVEVEAGGRALRASERLASLPPLAPEPLPARSSTFDATLVKAAAYPGTARPIGFLPPGPVDDEAPEPARVALLREVEGDVFVEIHTALAPAVPAFQPRPLPGLRDAHLLGTALARERVLVADDEQVLAVDARSGGLAWPAWRTPRGTVVWELAAHGGVAVVLVKEDDGDYVAVALDAHAGHELWRLFLPAGPSWRAPLFEDERAVFLTQAHGWEQAARALVVDLHRGATLGEVDLGGALPAESYDSAFVARGVLVVPAFRMASAPGRNRVTGFDLARRAEAWSYEFEGGRELEAVFQVEDSTYLVVRPGEDGRGGAVLQLEPRLGATRLVKELTLDDRVLGVARRRDAPQGPVKLDGPYLFHYTASPGQPTTRLTAVHLPYGRAWTTSLRVPYDDLYDVGVALPAVSASTVALAYTTKRENRLPGPTFVVLIDRESGTKRGDQLLSDALGRADDLRLVALGDALLMLSRDDTGGAPVEIWENRR